MFHPYTDGNFIHNTIPCYYIHKVLSEKLRALLKRNSGEARDYYDIWYLKNKVTSIDWQEVRQGFLEKCEYKEIAFSDVGDFFQPKRLPQVAITWKKRLSHQLTSEVNIDFVIEDLQQFLPKVFL